MRAALFATSVFSALSIASCGSPVPDVPHVPGTRQGGAESATFRVLLFVRTTGFRHDAIPPAIEAIEREGEQGGFAVDTTEDPTVFETASLARYKVVVFMLTTGDVLARTQEIALEEWLARGNGWLGVHSASDTEYEWPWYAGLVGAHLKTHPPGTPRAVVRVQDGTHLATRSLPSEWPRSDEWYDFREDPSPRVKVLLTVDESTYAGGTMGARHPVAWCRTYEGGRSIYTSLGHTAESWTDPVFVGHIVGALRWAAGEGPPGAC